MQTLRTYLTPSHHPCPLCTLLFLPAAQQATLLELLDAPQLMDTCVRNGIYDEALDLQAFIMRVSLLHPDMPVVKLLAAQVGAVRQHGLVEHLCTTLWTLPRALSSGPWPGQAQGLQYTSRCSEKHTVGNENQ